jgi:hypothetical protein
MKVSSVNLKGVMTKIRLVGNFFSDKKRENHPLTTTLIKNNHYPFTNHFIKVHIVCSNNLAGLKRSVLEKIEFEVRGGFLYFYKKFPFFQINRKLLGILKIL